MHAAWLSLFNRFRQKWRIYVSGECVYNDNISRVLYRKEVSRAGRSNYIPHVLWGVIAVPVLDTSGLILGLRPANERRRYFVTTSLIDWAQAENQPCTCF